jgi:hypothetical protein
MAQSSGKNNNNRSGAIPGRNRSENAVRQVAPADALRQNAAYVGMKLIPWGDVWKSLSTARFRGNGEMIEVFYDTLFKEAVFDDRGAWSLERERLH